MRYHKIPDETIRRLPTYLRGVVILAEKGLTKVSSKRLAEFLGANPWQIRKDFSYFGDFGTPGVGYDTSKLRKEISRILRLDSNHRAVLVGVGNLGSAVLAYNGFGRYGLDIVAAFDKDPKKIGKKKGNVTIEDVLRISGIKRRKVDLGIIAVPAEDAQAVADELVRAGVKGILSFSPRHIVVPRKVKVISIDIAMDLARLPYYMPSGQV
jgi:redox-sensing transcriptional repressor